MAEHQPIYRSSLAEARRLGELELWHESQAENIRCRDFIARGIARNHDGLRLGGDVAGDAIAEFGYDRVNLVLANTVQPKEHDGRISAANKDWAKDFYIADDKAQRVDFLIDEANPGLVDLVTSQARQAYEQLNLFDGTQCIAIRDFQTVVGQVLVVNPDCLVDEHKTPDTQLFLAKYGNGCRPNAIGRSIFGEFLIDGEQARYHRHEFLGVLKPELLPEWAVEKMAEPEDSAMEEAPGNNGMAFHGF